MLLPAGVGMALALSASVANAEFSGNVGLTSDYLFYGISQTSEGWAVSGGFKYTHEATGIYVGTWASTIDFNVPATDPAHLELDAYGGIAGELDNGLSWDIGLWYYGYPDQNEDAAGDYDYFEGYASFGYTFPGALKPRLGVGVNVSPDFFGETGTSVYPKVSLNLSLPQEFGFYAKYGYLSVDDINLDYGHYSVGFTKSVLGLDFDVSYNDADDDCGGDLCDAFVFTVSKSF
jgi:uncharacterized protein (TIGR02001 family)